VIVLAAGQHIGDRYQLDRRIAVGGMGEVWEASDNRLGRSVAVKILRPELSGDPEFLHRFRIEARTVASLDHHGIAAVHDYGESEGLAGRATAYLVMELVRGEPLSTHIARGPIEPNETLRLLEEAAWALQAAHERGFVHRDVKPGNILVRTDGTVKLTDFGIAKAADAVPVTRSGMVMGTAHYIAPEQASGAEAGPAGDVYSLGIVGYECLVGHRPFRAESAVAVAMMQVRDAPPPLPDTVPAPIRQLIDATLVKDPTQRYGTGGEFAEAVAAVRRGEPVPVPASISGSKPVLTPPRPAHVVAESGHDLGADPGVPAPRRPPLGPSTPPAPIVPLELPPAPRSGRGLLVAVFVLLTLAALALGVFILRGGVNLGELTLGRTETGSVTGWESLLAGWVVLIRPLTSRTAKGATR
jgi:serine/threonine-protein kinase